MKKHSIIGVCNYHLCKKKTRLFKCKYCGNYFCKIHIKPKMTLTPHQVFTAKEPIRSWLEKEYRSEYGHPDFAYTTIAWQKLEEREKEELEKRWKVLDELNKIPTTREPLEKPSIFPKPSTENIKRKLLKLLREIWYELEISLYSFLKYSMIALIVLTLLHVFLVGKFGLIPLILRSLGLVFLFHVVAYFYRKTKHVIPWKWMIITVLIILSTHIYSTRDYSVFKIFDSFTGIENFSNTLILSFSHITRSPIILKPQTEIGIGKTLFRYKSPDEILNDKIQELKNRSSHLEKEIHKLINQKRLQHGLTTLELDEKLSEIARYHSKDMATRNYFEHVSPEGESADIRYKKFNYYCRISVGNLIYSGAENLFLNNIIYSYYYDPLTGQIYEYTFKEFEEIVSSTVDGWMRGEGHRKNILTPFWRKQGIGVYVDADGEIYITQNFC